MRSRESIRRRRRKKKISERERLSGRVKGAAGAPIPRGRDVTLAVALWQRIVMTKATTVEQAKLGYFRRHIGTSCLCCWSEWRLVDGEFLLQLRGWKTHERTKSNRENPPLGGQTVRRSTKACYCIEDFIVGFTGWRRYTQFNSLFWLSCAAVIDYSQPTRPAQSRSSPVLVTLRLNR